MCSDRSGTPQRVPGFPIRTSTDRSLVGSSPWLLAATHVLLRLQAPRHPPLALCSLKNKDARARYEVLKGRAATPPPDNGTGRPTIGGLESGGADPKTCEPTTDSRRPAPNSQ